ncbi:MAG: hypothetical protein ACFB14_25605 [Leptolyngbyaceae cyanobacterium]
MWLKIPIDLETEVVQTHLLEELNRWIELGLISEGQSIRIGRKLCSPLPVQTPALIPAKGTLVAVETTGKKRTSSPRLTFARFKSSLVQSFLAEISVLWLLVLWVFLVVSSSGVLAASQWQSFSPVGQYAILLVYTLAFGGAGRWAANQAKLQTTAQMLKAATLLLIPLNMWMMDALGLASSLVGIVAGLGVSLLTLALAPQPRAGLNLLGLSWLHWGWGIGVWPLAATYIGTLGSAVNLVWGVPERPAAETAETADKPKPQPGSVLVAIALLLLIVRSLWIAQVPLDQLGLAFGTCGWLLCRLCAQYPLWPQLGAGLMLISWLGCVNQQPLQAIGISGLASWLLLTHLHRQTQEQPQQRTLTMLWLIGLQVCCLLWLTLPLGLRQTLLTALEPFGRVPISGLSFAGIWLHGYVGLMVLAAKQFQIQEQTVWARLTEKLALSISVVLVFCALPQLGSGLFTLSLIGLTLSLSAITYLRRSASDALIYSTHGAFLIAGLSGLLGIGADWTQLQWALVFLGLTTLEWLASAAGERYPTWRRSAWYLGIRLSVIAYTLLLDNRGEWRALIWLLVPGVLTWLVYQPNFATGRPQLATLLTVIALGGQVFLLSSWPMATVVFGLGAGLLFLHSCRWPTQKSLPALTVGFAVVGGHTAAIWLWLMTKPWPDNGAQFLLAMGLWAAVLSNLARPLNRQTQSLFKSYGAASQGWSRALAIALYLILTLTIVLSHSFGAVINMLVQAIPPDIDLVFRYGAAATTLVLARVLTQRRLTNPDYWDFAYGVGVLVTLGLSIWRQEVNLPLLGAAMVGLSLSTQLMGTIYSAKKQGSYPSSWHYIPLVYGALGLTLGHLTFTATTGLYAIVVGSVTLAISRRKDVLHPLSYGGLGLLSLGTYELVVYRMLQASGGAIGDGLTVLGLVGSVIALLYLLGNSWLQRYGKLTYAELSVTALVHWVLSVFLGGLAMLSGQSCTGVVLWLGLSSLLTLYALLKGNYRWFPGYMATAMATADDETRRFSNDHHSYRQWTWTGLTIATIAVPYGVEQLLTNLTLLRSWGALLACGLSLLIYRQPWPRWGWALRPWQRMSLIWPILAVLLSMTTVVTQSLLLVGAFYAFMAKRLQVRRLSYLSLGLLDWALLRYLLDQDWLTTLWLGTILGLSALYVLEIDPRWQSARQERHYLRSLATLLIGLTAIFQADIGPPIFIGLSLLISFGFIGLGLVTQVRAYLYTGTLTFALQILRTIMMFVGTDGRLLWAVGIMLGISLIWVAATFESRRAQISELLTHWSDRLATWD